LSPPSPPAGPIPIPYPNFSNASDTTNGTKTVEIGGKEVGQKKKSYYKTSKGDEAATKSLGMGVATHNIQGTTYHAAWSSDVKFEGENAIRQLDLTTHNHMSDPMNSGDTTVDVAGAAPAIVKDTDCEELDKANKDARKNLEDKTKDKTLVGPKGKGKGTTVSSFKTTPKSGGRSKIRTAHNNHKATAKRPKNFAKGGGKAVRNGDKATLCGNYTHPPPAKQKSGHAEARLFDELGAANPRNITLNIDWKPKRGKPSKMPCETCHKMLCKAAEKKPDGCEHDISLCDSKGNKQKLSDKKHCPANKNSYQTLKETMGEA